MPIIRKRLQVQREGMPTIDRSIVFVVGTLPEAQLRSLRGVIFHVETKIDASKLFRELHKYAKEAVTEEEIVRRSMARKKMGPPKNKHARRQPIPRELADELHRWMLTTPGEILFPGLRGVYLPNNSLNRCYTRLCEEAGIPRITSHGARHTAGFAYDQMVLGQRMIV